MFLAVGGTLLMVGVILQVYAVVHLMFFAPKGETEFPIADVEDNASKTPMWTESWGRVVVLLLLLVAMGYVIPLVEFIGNAPPGSPPFQTW